MSVCGALRAHGDVADHGLGEHGRVDVGNCNGCLREDRGDISRLPSITEGIGTVSVDDTIVPR